ncbi:MAG: hypothetical protein GX102_04520 [Porphyromonadaceae bacterium]|nr:hypothetical protein [Porphyromonadaceae bacterium]
MKKLGLLLIVVFAGFYLNLNAQTTTSSTTEAIAATEISDSSTIESENTEEPIEKLIEKAINSKIGNIDNDETQSTKFVGTVLFLVIALPALITFGAIVLIVFFATKHKKEAEKARHDLYLKSIEAGQPLPEKLFEKHEKQSSSLKKGAVWLAAGLGIVILGLINKNTTLTGIGVIPALVGVAFLLVYFIEKPKNDSEKTSVNE